MTLNITDDNRVLFICRSGHRSIGAAQAATGGATSTGKPGKTVIEQRYEQREYDPAQYNGLTQAEIEEALRYDT